MAASFSITRVTALWGRLNSSFWFVPAVMAVAAVTLSFLLIEVDALRQESTTNDQSAFYTFGPEGARAILSVIASSMLLSRSRLPIGAISRRAISFYPNHPAASPIACTARPCRGCIDRRRCCR